MRAGSLLFVLLVATGSTWAAVMEPDSGGGDNPPDVECEHVNCDRAKTMIAVGAYNSGKCSLYDDENRTNTEKLDGMYDCFVDTIDRLPGYNGSPYKDGNQVPLWFSVMKSDNTTEPECIGFEEDHENIGKVRLSMSSTTTGKVAKIFKFTELPSTTGDPHVRVWLNGMQNPHVVDCEDMTLNELNDEFEDALDNGYVILDKATYWIVLREEGTNAPIYSVTVDADDPLLTRLHLELRPVNSMNQYGSNCGDSNFIP